jgi:transposase
MNKNRPISRYKIKKIMKCFCVDVTAVAASRLLGINRNTINAYYGAFRRAIYAHQTAQLRQLTGAIEVDESYFGASRPRGLPGPRKRGRGTDKQPVFGIYERDGRVYTEIIPDCSKATLQAIIRGKVAVQSVIHSDGWKGYDGLVDVGYDKHFRVNHSKQFANGKGIHVNGIESFWSFTKRRLAKFNGTKVNFLLHLKESEWRWNRDYVQLFAELPLITKLLLV